VIFINLLAIFFGNKLVTWNVEHGGEYAFVPNAAGAQLRFDHVAALGEKGIDLGF